MSHCVINLIKNEIKKVSITNDNIFNTDKMWLVLSHNYNTFIRNILDSNRLNADANNNLTIATFQKSQIMNSFTSIKNADETLFIFICIT